MQSRARTSVFLKMVGIFVVLTVAIGATWVASLIYFYQRSDRASIAHSIANEIDIWMLQARRNEKDFQLRDIRTPDFYEKGQGANVQAYGVSMAQLTKAIDRLEAMHQVERKSMEDLRAAAQEYGQAFARLVDAYRQRGFSDWGAEGGWRAAAHSLESRLDAVNNAALMISLLTIRRHEKDYLLRADPAYITQLTAEADNLRAGARRLAEPTRSAVLGDLDRYMGSLRTYLGLQAQIGATEDDGLQGAMRASIHRVEPLVAAIVEETMKVSQSESAYRSLLLSVFVIMIAGLVAGGLVFGLFARSITGPVRRMVTLLQNVADGDLRESVGGDLLAKRDEIGLIAGAIGSTSEKLRAMVTTIQENAAQVAASSRQITDSAHSLSEGSQSGASSLEQTSAAVEELTSSVQQVSEHAQSQAAAAEQGTASMDQVRTSIDAVARSLSEISELAARSADSSQEGARAVAEAVAGIGKIAESSARITGIVTVISEIADQTNLLALNAAIEAARAGDHGRGFAVVADEVSKLAERSSASAKEIEDLIRESERNVKQGVEAARGSQGSMEQIREASEKVKDMIVGLSDSMQLQVAAVQELAAALSNVGEMSQGISAATEEQASSAKQVSRAVESVAEVTQQAAAAAEQMSSATVQLSAMAQALLGLVGQFKVPGEAGATPLPANSGTGSRLGPRAAA